MSDENDGKVPQKRKVGRSPAYPNMSVQKALEKAKALYDREGEYAAPLSAAASAWDYSAKSSGARQLIATLRYYGLIDVTGDGDARKIKVSDLARRILFDRREDDTEKRELIRKVALNPAVHRTIYDQYKSGLASDANVTHFLVFDHGYNKSAAEELLDEYKATAKYAGLYDPLGDLDKEEPSSDDGAQDRRAPEIKIGDLIQWSSQGVDQFSRGARVLGFSDDGQWIFTDQGKSGVPLNEVSVVEASTPTPPQMPSSLQGGLAFRPNRDTDESQPGSRKAVFPVEEGDVTLIFPENISADGLEELGQYLDIFLKKEQRKRQ